MKTLLEFLGEELHKQVTEKLGEAQIFLHEKDQKVLIDDGKLIPSYRLEEVTSKNKHLTDQLGTAEAEIKEFKKNAKGNEELTAKIQQYQDEAKLAKENYEKKEILDRKKFLLKTSLMDSGVVDPEARELLLNKFDIEKIELAEDGKIKDFDTLLKPIKENKTLVQLFGEVKIKGREMKSPTGDPNEYYSREQVQAMSQDEVNKNYEVISKSMALWDKN